MNPGDSSDGLSFGDAHGMLSRSRHMHIEYIYAFFLDVILIFTSFDCSKVSVLLGRQGNLNDKPSYYATMIKSQVYSTISRYTYNINIQIVFCNITMFYEMVIYTNFSMTFNVSCN